MWALLAGMVGSAVGTTLMKHSAFGLSAFYSVSLALYESTHVLTMGTWNVIYQVSLIVLLSILLRRFRLSYLASFLVVAGSSVAIDGCNLLFAYLPVTFPWRIGCFLAGQLILSFAISFLALCKLPVMPMNLFVRELADAIGVPFSRVKLFFDLGCLTFSSVVSLIFAGHLAGVGPGTILSVALTAPLTGWFIKGQNKKITYYI